MYTNNLNMIGAQTIGNATVIAYDRKPILSTDLWLGSDHAYFRSWYLPYEIPEQINQDILDSKYIFFSRSSRSFESRFNP